MKLNEMSATELAKRLAQREVTALQIVNQCLEVIQERDRELHAWAAVDADFARRQAKQCDAGAVRGPLHGLPVGVKDILDTADLPSEYGTPIYAGHRPRADAACVAIARAAGAVILGKTVTTEFATMNPAYAGTVNPHNPRHTPGGSSSGSAAGVAAHMVHFGYGTQTVGSIIRPAAYCGVVGYKPTFATLPRNGMKMACESLDTIGGFARTVDDVALFVGGSSMRTLQVTVVEKPRLGVCRSPMWSSMTKEGIAAFEAGVKRLAQAGATIVERELPREFDELDALRFKLQTYEIARNLAYDVAHHRSQFSAVLLEAIDAGAKVPHTEYVRAQEFADARRRQLADHMRDVDALVTPSATGEAPLGLQSTGDTAMNRLWTLMHGPCVTVPAGRGASGLPVGLQFYGVPWADSRTLGVAKWAEGVVAR